MSEGTPKSDSCHSKKYIGCVGDGGMGNTYLCLDIF